MIMKFMRASSYSGMGFEMVVMMSMIQVVMKNVYVVMSCMVILPR